ncbi:exo-alpha-sialidase [Arthrobacter sp. NPDC056493]|uniref:sialidase family protein n=1 Tax=Arthrobacter sp. NPDC056493 TaxID=3345839 RepID=UPI0036717E6E
MVEHNAHFSRSIMHSSQGPRTSTFEETAQGLAFQLLPTSARENHASFITGLGDGALGCAWFAGSAEGKPDVDIVMSTLSSGEGNWAEERVVAATPGRSDQNPVLFRSPTGELVLLHTAQVLGAQDTSRVLLRRSSDGGESWSEPAEIAGDPGLFIRQPVVAISPTRWLLPAFRCLPLPGRQWRGSADVTVVLITDDAGTTWREVEVPESTGLVHMAIVRRSEGRLLGFFRSRWADRVYRTTSADEGETWSAPTPTEVPNNNSSIAVGSREASGPLLLVANPVAAPEGAHEGDDDELLTEGKYTAPGTRQPLARHAVWGTPRLPLTLLLSDDEGQSWRSVLDLEDSQTLAEAGIVESEAEYRGLEISYPSLYVDDAGTAHVTYSYLRDAIKYVRVPAAVWGH